MARVALKQNRCSPGFRSTPARLFRSNRLNSCLQNAGQTANQKQRQLRLDCEGFSGSHHPRFTCMTHYEHQDSNYEKTALLPKSWQGIPEGALKVNGHCTPDRLRLVFSFLYSSVSCSALEVCDIWESHQIGNSAEGSRNCPQQLPDHPSVALISAVRSSLRESYQDERTCIWTARLKERSNFGSAILQ